MKTGNRHQKLRSIYNNMKINKKHNVPLKLNEFKQSVDYTVYKAMEAKALNIKKWFEEGGELATEGAVLLEIETSRKIGPNTIMGMNFTFTSGDEDIVSYWIDVKLSEIATGDLTQVLPQSDDIKCTITCAVYTNGGIDKSREVIREDIVFKDITPDLITTLAAEAISEEEPAEIKSDELGEEPPADLDADGEPDEIISGNEEEPNTEEESEPNTEEI